MNRFQLKIKIIILFMLSITAVYAQDSTMYIKHPPQKHPKSIFDNIFTGGNIGLQFGTVTFADISPLIGYRFTDKIQAGIGATYQYYHYKDRVYDFTTNVYGARIFGRYFFTDYLFAHVEYENLNLEAFDFHPRRRVDVGSLMAGGGYFQHFAPNSGFVIMLLYNFTESAYTPYSNPIFRVGLIIGL